MAISEDCPPGTPSGNVARVAKLESDALGARSLGARCATGLIRVAGTTTFAVVHLVWFVAWVAVNTGVVPGTRPFDPYPFNFLTLVVSLDDTVSITHNYLNRDILLRALKHHMLDKVHQHTSRFGRLRTSV